MTYLYLDCETMGLDLNEHDVWEIAYAFDDEPIHSGIVPHTHEKYDAAAMVVNNHWKRCPTAEPEGIAPSVENILIDTLRHYASDGIMPTVVGANPSFDTYRLERRWGKGWWHHRLIDVSVLGMGLFGTEHPIGFSTLHERLLDRGWDIPHPDHTAAGDVACTRGVFHALQIEYKKVEVPF